MANELPSSPVDPTQYQFEDLETLWNYVGTLSPGGGGGSGTPAGSPTEVQFNTGGGFDADPGLTFVASTTDTLSVGVASTSAGVVNLLNTGTYKIDGTDVLAATALGSAIVSSSLTSVGTISTGAWEGTVIDELYGGTGFATYTTGDILYASGTNILSKLALTADGKYLSSVGGVPSWVAAPSATAGGVSGQVQINSIGNLAGDEGLTYVVGLTSTLSVGSALSSAGVIDLQDAGTYNIAGIVVLDTSSLGSTVVNSSLTSVGTIATGTWEGTAVDELYGGTGFSTYATGDVLYASGVNTLAKLAAGSNTEVLTLAGGVPTWAAPDVSKDTYTAQATSFTASSDAAYFITGNSVVVTLPVAPAASDFVVILNGAAVTGCSVARNGKTIMGSASDLTIDTGNFTLRFIYYSATGDWRIS